MFDEAHELAQVSTRAARGAEWLDENEPGWHDRINLDKLDIEHNCDCTFGQLFGTFTDSAERIGDEQDQIDHGIFVPAYGHRTKPVPFIEQYYSSLTDAWYQLIMGRRSDPTTN